LIRSGAGWANDAPLKKATNNKPEIDKDILSRMKRSCSPILWSLTQTFAAEVLRSDWFGLNSRRRARLSKRAELNNRWQPEEIFQRRNRSRLSLPSVIPADAGIQAP
jgi:hypothetical protein